MRTLSFGLKQAVSALLLLVSLAPASARDVTFATNERVLEWIYSYRNKPQPNRVPDAVRAMKELGLLADQEKAGFFIGFVAGVLRDNESKADALVAKMFPMPPKEQAMIIKAIAYSGMPSWHEVLSRHAPRMPERKQMIDDFLSGKTPTLMAAPLESNVTLIYTLWGYYVATGYYAPVRRIITVLPLANNEDDSGTWDKVKTAVGWSTEKIDLDKITVGGTAKWTLSSYAERHRDLLGLYRVEMEVRPPEVTEQLKEVIAAAEAYDSERIRKQGHASIEEAKRMVAKQGSSMSRAAYAGSVALATGCVVAGATGHIYIAVPCVVTGAVYTGAMKLMADH